MNGVQLWSERSLVRAVMRRSPDADDALAELAVRSIGADDEWRQAVADLRHEFMDRA